MLGKILGIAFQQINATLRIIELALCQGLDGFQILVILALIGGQLMLGQQFDGLQRSTGFIDPFDNQVTDPGDDFTWGIKGAMRDFIQNGAVVLAQT